MSRTEHGSGTVAIVGGGLAGLVAAATLARAGRPAVVFEKAGDAGGRARTQREQGFEWNLGPHALYLGAAAARTLKALRVPFAGGKPAVNGFVLDRGVKHTMPGGLVSLVTTRLFGLGAKLETARLLAGLARVDAATLADVRVDEWLRREIAHDDVRRLVAALFRLATYANSPAQSAGAAIANLQSALAHGVLYLDHGWQTLVDGLRDVAVEAGARIETGVRVDAVLHDDRVRGVRLADGREEPCDAVIVAGAPADAAALVPGATPLAAWATAATPVRAACLDVGLSRLPVAGATFALGVDQPLYVSVHSAAAKLHPAGGVVVHVAKYLPVGADGAPGAREPETERELEGALDLLQPGWRDAVVARRFLPGLVVANALVSAAGGGLPGRPGPAVPGIGGLYVAGDWVGREGLLFDASAASATEAARLVVAESVRAAA